MPKKNLFQTYAFPERAARNLGTFNTHYMNSEARDVFQYYANVNGVDSHAYPELDYIKAQCATFLLDLFHADNMDDFRYFTTSGSSESVFLAVLALKKQHQHLNPDLKIRPNLIIGENSHIAWFKTARYLDIELRIAPLSSTLLTIDNDQVMTLVDAGTIGICCTLGAPTTLLCDDVSNLNIQLKHYQKNTGQFIGIHVDAASGGFVLPFVYPDELFDFGLEHVVSINVSSHKYGLIYPSLGWLLMRYTDSLDDLLDESAYLGASIKQFSMQFSHSASHLMAQYYTIQTVGFIGYKNIMLQLYTYAEQLKCTLATEIQCIESTRPSLPGVVFSIKNRDMADVSKQLKQRNWYLPVYSLPGSLSKLQVGRVVVRHGFNEALIDELSMDIRAFEILFA